VKEICYHLGVERTTVWRWKADGAPFVNNRILESQLVWWLEQRDAAKVLGISVRSFLLLEREVREKLLEAAVLEREARAHRKHVRCNNLQHPPSGGEAAA
jgi:hypothetical protein